MLICRESPQGQFVIAISVCFLGSVEDESSPHVVAVWQLGSSQGSGDNQVQLTVPLSAKWVSCCFFFFFFFCNSAPSVRMGQSRTCWNGHRAQTWWSSRLCLLLVLLSCRVFWCTRGVPSQVVSLRPLWPSLRGIFAWEIFTDSSRKCHSLNWYMYLMAFPSNCMLLSATD